MTKATIHRLLILAAAAFVAACTMTRTPAPPLQGPSELGLSLTSFANPDTISQDGASQSLVAVQAFDANGQPAKNIAFRAEIMVNGVVSDFGSISARTLVTGNDGRATVIYTAPPPPLAPLDTNASVSIRLTPTAGDLSNVQPRTISIRLVPPGAITGNLGPSANFTVTPGSPQAFVPATFTSTSAAGAGGVLVSYHWDFGDGGQATGSSAIHQFSNTGSYLVTLTVTDNNGRTGAASRLVTVAAGNLPTARLTYSPTTGLATNQPIFFTAAESTAGVGRRIVRYDWDFGTGSTGSGVNVTKSYDTPGTYRVTLTVTDDVGQFDIDSGTTVTISANGTSAAGARFTFTPSPGRVGEPVTFDGTSSSTSNGAIVRYEWDFDNNGVTDETTYAPFATTQHVFTAAGTHTVRLTVYDSNGGSPGSTTNDVVIFP